MEAKWFLMIRQDNSICLYREGDGVQYVLFDSLDESDNHLLAHFLDGTKAGVDYEVVIEE